MGKIMLNGKQYGVGGITDADDIKYTDSQTVKGALDEVKNDLTNQFREVSVSFNDSTIPASATFEIAKTIDVPSGYHPLCLRGWNFSRLNGLTVTRVTVSSSSVTVGGYNASSTTTLNGSATVLCVNNY